MVRTPNSARIAAVLAPTPQRREMGSGARNVGLGPGGHDHQPVGLLEIGRDLGHELGRGHADRDRQLQLVVDRGLDGARHLDGRAEERLGAGHVEEGLVDGDLLDGRRVATQDLHDLRG